MRVRRFGLRLVGGALVVGWAAAAALVLLAYRPGGPWDILVGLTMAAPVAIAFAGVAWPPIARGDRAFAGVAWLGIGALLCLIPSVAGVYEQLRALGSQTLLPSLEAAYPWLLALVATSLFSGLGIAGHRRGGTGRRRRLGDGLVVAIGLTVISASLFAGAALANEVAVRDTPAAASRFGPTAATGDPPPCDADLGSGSFARLSASLSASLDRRQIGTVDLAGQRAGDDFVWSAYLATDRDFGLVGVARIGDLAWWRDPGRGWTTTSVARAASETVDRQVAATALLAANRTTAEDRGVEVIERARARRCRVAVDGEMFGAAFPQIEWLVGDLDLHRWRGQLDYWIFMDGELGQVAGSATGDAIGIDPTAIQATVTVRLTATERDRPLVLYPPTR